MIKYYTAQKISKMATILMVTFVLIISTRLLRTITTTAPQQRKTFLSENRNIDKDNKFSSILNETDSESRRLEYNKIKYNNLDFANSIANERVTSASSVIGNISKQSKHNNENSNLFVATANIYGTANNSGNGTTAVITINNALQALCELFPQHISDIANTKTATTAPVVKIPNISYNSTNTTIATDKAVQYRKSANVSSLTDWFGVPNRFLQNTTSFTVFYIWCGQKALEFSTFVSILSVHDIVKPQQIVFFYSHLPVLDNSFYNTWFMELLTRKEELNLVTIPLAIHSTRACRYQNKSGLPYQRLLNRIFQLFDNNALYMDVNTILTNHFKYHSNTDLNTSIKVYVNNESEKVAYVLRSDKLKRSANVKYFGIKENSSAFHVFSNASRALGAAAIPKYCQAPSKYTTQSYISCITLTNLKLFPKDIWDSKSDFAKLVRKYVYGKSTVMLPAKNTESLTPNVANLVWIGGGEMDFLFYLCVLSLIYVAEVQRVYIHGELPPTGNYWTSLAHNSKVKYVFKEVPTRIYGAPVRVRSHISDFWRGEFMIKYGGIYIDTDAVFVKKLSDDIQSYDAVGVYDLTFPNDTFPDTVNFGVTLGKRNATFWHLFKESFHWFRDDDWTWNGLRLPYKIKERQPELLHIEPHLQVICLKCKCSPSWWPHYKEIGWEGRHTHHRIKDWQKEAYVYHWTTPTPWELKSEQNLLKSNTMFAEIGKFILHKSKLLKSDNVTLVHSYGDSTFQRYFRRQTRKTKIIIILIAFAFFVVFVVVLWLYINYVFKKVIKTAKQKILCPIHQWRHQDGCLRMAQHPKILS